MKGTICYFENIKHKKQLLLNNNNKNNNKINNKKNKKNYKTSCKGCLLSSTDPVLGASLCCIHLAIAAITAVFNSASFTFSDIFKCVSISIVTISFLNAVADTTSSLSFVSTPYS